MSTVDKQKEIVEQACKIYRAIPWVRLSQKQRDSSRDAAARGPIWVARTNFIKPPESDLSEALNRVILNLSEHYQRSALPSLTPQIDVGVEFIGPRVGAKSGTTEPDMPELEKLRALEADCDPGLTILYIHGGGLYFSSPAEYRAASARLARMTKSRIASIKYRLAPVHAFPAPVLDVLVAYASLLYPPPNSLYSSVPASRVVLAGNSAGVNLALGLIKFLLAFQNLSSQKITFHGRLVPLPLPGGVTMVSGWCDPCDSLPSWHHNSQFDILGVLQPACMPKHPTDTIWPTDPPREHPYCTAAMLDHQLVCPAAVSDWKGAPPFWFACGSEERGVDGNRVVAAQAAKCGVSVTWNEYQGMPHEFPIIVAKLPQARHAFDLWTKACLTLGAGAAPDSTSSLFLMPDCKHKNLGALKNLLPLPFDEIRRRMKEYNATRPVWTGQLFKAKL